MKSELRRAISSFFILNSSFLGLALLVFAALAFGPPAAPAAVTEVWVHRYNNVVNNSSDWAAKVVRDAAGDIIVTGTSESDMLTIKYSGADGSVLWQRRSDGTANNDDYTAATAMAVVKGRCPSPTRFGRDLGWLRRISFAHGVEWQGQSPSIRRQFLARPPGSRRGRLRKWQSVGTKKMREGTLLRAFNLRANYRRKWMGSLCGISWAQGALVGASAARSVALTTLLANKYASTSSPLTSASIWPLTSTQGLSICPLFSIISCRWSGSLMISRSS
jgi:hypothetical protein